MGINVQGAEGGNSASPLLCRLIETLVELKSQLWRKSVEKIVRILTWASFSIRKRADSWTETTHRNKYSCLLTAVRRREGWQWQPQDPTSGGVSLQSLSSVPEKHWNRDYWTQKYQGALSQEQEPLSCEPRPLGDASGSLSAHLGKDFRHQEGKCLQSKQWPLIREHRLVFELNVCWWLYWIGFPFPKMLNSGDSIAIRKKNCKKKIFKFLANSRAV